MIRAKICERMGWDWWTYRRQPVRFIQELLRTWESEAAAQKDK